MTKFMNKKTNDSTNVERKIYFTKNKENTDTKNPSDFEQIEFAENFVDLDNSDDSLEVDVLDMTEDDRMRLLRSVIDREKKELDTMMRLVEKQTQSIQNSRKMLTDKQLLLQLELSKKASKFSTNEKLSLIGDLSVKMAHDIKNPITVLKSQIELLKLQFSKNENSIMLGSLNRMDKAISIIMTQFDDMLHFLREEPQYDFEECDVRQIIRDALFGIKIPSNINLRWPSNDIALLCDKSKLQRVFANLIQNSIHAMENGGEISVEISENKEDVTIKVQDSGPGIAEDKLDKIFQPLFTTKKYGTGLGLVICKQIVEAHHGSISLHNNPTTFTIKIPKQSRKN